MLGLYFNEYYFIKVRNTELSDNNVKDIISNVQKANSIALFQETDRTITYTFKAGNSINIQDYFFLIRNNKMITNLQILIEILAKLIEAWKQYQDKKYTVDLRFEKIWIKSANTPFTTPQNVQGLQVFILEADIFQSPPKNQSENELKYAFQAKIRQFCSKYLDFLNLLYCPQYIINSINQILKPIMENFNEDKLIIALNQLISYSKQKHNQSFGKYFDDFQLCKSFNFRNNDYPIFYNMLFSNLQNWIIKQLLNISYKAKHYSEIFNQLKLDELLDLFGFLANNKNVSEEILMSYMVENKILNTLQNLYQFKLAEFQFFLQQIKEQNESDQIINILHPEFKLYCKKLLLDQNRANQNNDLDVQKSKVLSLVNVGLKQRSEKIYQLFQEIYKDPLDLESLEQDIFNKIVGIIDTQLAEGRITLKQLCIDFYQLQQIIEQQLEIGYLEKAFAENQAIAEKLIYKN